jgi:hypothetical protein
VLEDTSFNLNVVGTACPARRGAGLADPLRVHAVASAPANDRELARPIP